jgi:hypothetical protein
MKDEKVQRRRDRQLNKNISIDRITVKQSLSLKGTNNNDEASPEIKNSYLRKGELRKKSEHRVNTIEMIRWGEESARLQEEKKQQLLSDYMIGKLKRSKSQEINPKDAYRMEIEEMVAQLTPIEDLQEADKKMQRLKRRAKHLHTFDKNYYSKLNQHDMVILS